MTNSYFPANWIYYVAAFALIGSGAKIIHDQHKYKSCTAENVRFYLPTPKQVPQNSIKFTLK